MKYIEENLEWLQRAQKIAHMGLYDQDPVNDTLWWSDETYRIFGLSQQHEPMDFERFLLIVHPDDRELIREKTKRSLESDAYPYNADYRIVLWDNKIRHLHEEAIIERDAEGVPVRIVGIVRDVTKEKEAEILLKASIREKETLLQEIHHRVKNNLSVVSSLLYLQAESTNNSEIKSVLKDSQNRITTISMIHQSLYNSDNLAEIDMQTYLSQLGAVILHGFNPDGKIRLSVTAKNISIKASQATPVGLIVNELITNSLKYAFPDNSPGLINVRFHAKGGAQNELIVMDNGIGIPEEMDIAGLESLGLKLVTNITERQLDGRIELDRTNGTRFTIRFPLDST